MTSAELQPFIQQMDAALVVARRTVATIGDATLRAQHVGTVGTMAKAADAWKTTQASEVLRGVRPFERWRSWGQDLLKQVADEAQDAGTMLAQFSRLANAAGDAAQWIASKFSFINDRLVELERQDRELGARVKAFQAERLLFKNRKISPATAELLGPKGDAALASYARLHSTVVFLRQMVDRVRGGTARLEADGKGDVNIVATATTNGTLGAVPVLAAGTVIAVVAVASAAASSLYVFFRHLDEATRAELTSQKLQLIREGRGAEVNQLERLQLAAEESRNSSSFVTALKWVAGGVVLVGVLYAAVEFNDAYNRRRAA